MTTEIPEDLPPYLPPLRLWNLTENSTIWDVSRAAPNDDARIIQWAVWAAVTMAVAIFVIFVFVAVLRSAKARKNPFNLYLLFLMFPDFFFSFGCSVTCIFNSVHGYYWGGTAMCYYQSVSFIFAIGANTYINALIARQLYLMLSNAQHFRRYHPPSRTQVVKHCLIAYMWAVFLSLWGIIDQSWWPHKTYLHGGRACVPVPYDKTSTLFFWLVFVPILVGLPMGYVLFVTFRVIYGGWIPKRGHRRVLASVFLRMTTAYLIMWAPTLILIYVTVQWTPQWIIWLGGTWSHMQGAVSAAVSLWMPDVYSATMNLLNCRTEVIREKSKRTSATASGEYDDSNMSFRRFKGISKKLKKGSTAKGGQPVLLTPSQEEEPCDVESIPSKQQGEPPSDDEKDEDEIHSLPECLESIPSKQEDPTFDEEDGDITHSMPECFHINELGNDSDNANVDEEKASTGE